jgi:hypothetical protein
MSSRGVTFGGDLETKRKAPEPRIPRTTLRQQRSDRYEARWNWKAALRRRRAERRKKKGQHAKDKKLPPVRGSDFIRLLELSRDATGDPIFNAALAAVVRYGLDREPQRTADRIRRQEFGDPLDDFLVQVAFLVQRGLQEPGGQRKRNRRKLSVREACECVAGDAGIPGSSFRAIVKKLRQRYQAQRPVARRPLQP